MIDNLPPGAHWEDDDSDLVAPTAAATDFATDDGHDPSPLCDVTNPEGSVSVTALIGGQIHRIALSTRATSMTEPELAEEITVLAGLARQKAHAAQHELVVDIMCALGNDRVATRSFLEHGLGLPSPEAVNIETSRIFATRYTSEAD